MNDNDIFLQGIQTTTINRRYIISRLLGEGAFGKVYQGYNKKTNDLVAIKISIQKNYSLLCNEAKILNYLYSHGCRNIPTMYWYGTIHFNFTCMVIPFYNTCLFDARNKKVFSLDQTHNVAIQGIDTLEQIHKNFVIHRDIKPQNFMIHCGELILIDFGLATFYMNSENQHNPMENNHVDITGSPKYITPNIHRGINASRRDDLISFAYVLLYLLLGKLEWDEISPPPHSHNEMHQKSHIHHYNNITRLDKKRYENIALYCTCNTILNFIRYCYDLDYDERPDYDSCKKIFTPKTI